MRLASRVPVFTKESYTSTQYLQGGYAPNELRSSFFKVLISMKPDFFKCRSNGVLVVIVSVYATPQKDCACRMEEREDIVHIGSAPLASTHSHFMWGGRGGKRGEEKEGGRDIINKKLYNVVLKLTTLACASLPGSVYQNSLSKQRNHSHTALTT